MRVLEGWGLKSDAVYLRNILLFSWLIACVNQAYEAEQRAKQQSKIDNILIPQDASYG